MRRLKDLIKLAGACLLLPLLALLALPPLLRPRPRRTRLRVLYYHAVPDHAAASFRRQMRLLARFTRVVDAACTTPIPSRRPLYAITFDDAFQSVARNALPVLSELGFPTTVFAPSGCLGSPPGWEMDPEAADRAEIIMSETELAGLCAPLVTIGSHTVSHPHLSVLPEEDLLRELSESRTALSQLLGQPVEGIAFPYGDHNQHVVDVCRKVGYAAAYTIAPQPARLATDYARGRFAVHAHDNRLVFLLKASGATSWPQALARLARTIKGPMHGGAHGR